MDNPKAITKISKLSPADAIPILDSVRFNTSSCLMKVSPLKPALRANIAAIAPTNPKRLKTPSKKPNGARIKEATPKTRLVRADICNIYTSFR